MFFVTCEAAAMNTSWFGRHAQVGAVVLGEVKAREPGLVGQLDQLEPVLEQLLRRRARDVLDVVEDAEGRCRHGKILSRSVSVLSITSHAVDVVKT